MRIFVGSTTTKKKKNKIQNRTEKYIEMGNGKEKKVHFDLHILALSNTPFMTLTALCHGNPGSATHSPPLKHPLLITTKIYY